MNFKISNKTVSIATGLFITIIVFFFISLEPLIRFILYKKMDAYGQRFGAEISLEKFEYKGLRTFEFHNLCIKPEQGDTLLTIGYINARLNLLQLMLLRARLNYIQMKDVTICLVKTDTLTSNYLFLWPKTDAKQKSDTLPAGSVNYYLRMETVLNKIFGNIPKETLLENFKIDARLMGNHFSMELPRLQISGKKFTSDLILTDNNDRTIIHLEGQVNRREKKLEGKLYGLERKKVHIPYLLYRWNTQIQFDTLQFSLDSTIFAKNEISLRGKTKLIGFKIFNPKISSQEVAFDKGVADYRFNIGENYIEMDSISQFEFNLLSARPFIRFEHKLTGNEFTLKLNKKPFEAQDLFSSLPAGLFYNLQGIKAKGQLSFHLNFKVNLDYPDTIVFQLALIPHNFEITHYGNTDFRYINEPFIYTVYENGDSITSILTGPENPGFTTLDKIPLHISQTIMTSEDGQFFSHNGFIPDEIKNAISTNIKKRKFARGGSTITMQLVKNVFLNRNKTVARKFEEALIVWLIESQKLVSKERMFEIYLNILESGPHIYGVSNGAKYYFNKKPDQITLSEALFMASVIPRPKKFKYLFDDKGHMQPFMEGYYRFVSGKMLELGYISQADYDSVKTNVLLSGPAREIIIKNDSLQTDSLIFEPGVTETEE